MPFIGFAFGMGPAVAERALLLAAPVLMPGLNCPHLRGTAPEVERESSGSPFRDAAERHPPGCLREEPVGGGELVGGG